MKIKKEIKQFALYLVVGGLATLVEWAMFYVTAEKAGINYMAATALAFIVSTFFNWLFGRIIMFHSEGSVLKELIKIYLTSIAGLVMNLILMWLEVDLLGFNKMLSKIIATGIVFFWNFLVRKFLIYKI